MNKETILKKIENDISTQEKLTIKFATNYRAITPLIIKLRETFKEDFIFSIGSNLDFDFSFFFDGKVDLVNKMKELPILGLRRCKKDTLHKGQTIYLTRHYYCPNEIDSIYVSGFWYIKNGSTSCKIVYEEVVTTQSKIVCE